jgi:phage regulator Rha-like protein
MILKSIIDFFSGGVGKVFVCLLLAASLFFGVQHWKSNLLEECQKNTRIQVELEMKKDKELWVAEELAKYKVRLIEERKIWDEEQKEHIKRILETENSKKAQEDVQSEIEVVVKYLPCNNVGNDFIRLLNKAQGTEQ